MKLFYIEDKYILIYRFVIVFVLTITILISLLGGIYGVTKWSGLLSGIDKIEKKDNEFKNPDKNEVFRAKNRRKR